MKLKSYRPLWVVALLLVINNAVAQEYMLTGKVSDKQGKPIEGVRILTDELSKPAISDKEGEFRIVDFTRQGAPKSVMARKQGLSLLQWNYSEKENKLYITMGDAFTLKGQLFDLQGQPMPQTDLMLNLSKDDRYRSKTDAEGKFSIPIFTRPTDASSLIFRVRNSDKLLASDFVLSDNEASVKVRIVRDSLWQIAQSQPKTSPKITKEETKSSPKSNSEQITKQLPPPNVKPVPSPTDTAKTVVLQPQPEPKPDSANALSTPEPKEVPVRIELVYRTWLLYLAGLCLVIAVITFALESRKS